MIALKKILVATDFGPESDAAVRYGRELARGFGGSLHVMHVTENLFSRVMDAYSYAGLSPDVQMEIERGCQKQTEELLSEEDRRELKATAVTVTSNRPAAAIVDYARDHGIDLIVIGTHGRGPLGHLMLGNVAERVVRTAPCPVLTVRHPEHEFVFPDALVRAAHV
jgi:nucleotide-binding universal stress UspA family protein